MTPTEMSDVATDRAMRILAGGIAYSVRCPKCGDLVEGCTDGPVNGHADCDTLTAHGWHDVAIQAERLVGVHHSYECNPEAGLLDRWCSGSFNYFPL